MNHLPHISSAISQVLGTSTQDDHLLVNPSLSPYVSTHRLCEGSFQFSKGVIHSTKLKKKSLLIG